MQAFELWIDDDPPILAVPVFRVGIVGDLVKLAAVVDSLVDAVGQVVVAQADGAAGAIGDRVHRFLLVASHQRVAPCRILNINSIEMCRIGSSIKETQSLCAPDVHWVYGDPGITQRGVQSFELHRVVAFAGVRVIHTRPSLSGHSDVADGRQRNGEGS